MTRRGVSLIELMVIMSAASAVLSTSAVILHRTMRSQEQTRYFFENEHAAQRLARQFRADVRGAVSLEMIEVAVANVDPEGTAAEPFLTLRLADSAGEDEGEVATIEYRRTATGILRTATSDDGPTAREDYAIASIAQIQLREDTSPRRLVLTITADPADLHPQLGERTPTIRDTPVNMEAVAIVGRDARFVPKAADAADVSARTEEDNAP
jgi:type II secretory pathway component PulJ